MDSVDLGNRIREARKKKNYTQQKLAEEADIGEVYLSEIERGTKMPSLKVFMKIADALNVSADYLLRYELSSGEYYIYDEITEKMKGLSSEDRRVATEILDAYIRNK